MSKVYVLTRSMYTLLTSLRVLSEKVVLKFYMLCDEFIVNQMLLCIFLILVRSAEEHLP